MASFINSSFPSLAASFGLGYKVGADGKEAIKKDLTKTKIEKELLQNKIDSDSYFDNHDPIEDAIERGALPNGSGRKSPGTDSNGV